MLPTLVLLFVGCGSTKLPTGAAPTPSVGRSATSASVAPTSSAPSSTSTVPDTTTRPATAPTSLVVATATEQLVYQPFLPGALKSDVAVERDLSGSCWEGSLTALNRPDAWRCMAGDEILDPCFENPYPSAPLAVICAANPGKPVTRLLLATGLPGDMRNTTVDGTSLAWVLQLANGAFCGSFSGNAPASVAGQQITWGCDDGTNIIGGLNADTPLWTATIDSSSSSSGAIASIARMWR